MKIIFIIFMVMFTSCSRNEILFKLSEDYVNGMSEDDINRLFDEYSMKKLIGGWYACLLYTSPSPRD